MRIPATPKTLDVALSEAAKAGENFLQLITRLHTCPLPPGYQHWDKLRHRKPPENMSSEQWWTGIKLRRSASMRDVPLRDKKGSAFRLSVPDIVAEQLHQIDQGAGRMLGNAEPVTNPQTRDRYLMRSLIEEAITSSQLEGAATTRDVAKQMLSTGRNPRDRGEQMILNNYRTMQRIRELRDQELSPSLVLEIHRMIGRDALDKPDAPGRLRLESEPVDVPDMEGNVLHVPPPASELPDRLEAMCEFANAESPDYFIHPVVRSIILHFWLAYDHPFVDGNGRTARALFYWSMLRHGYWLFEFISISEILLKAPIKYGRAFLYTETDENDLTYFIVHQLGVIRQAVDALHGYIDRKTSELGEVRQVLDRLEWLNHRQEALLVHALRHPGARYSIAEHQGRHGVSYATARADLLGLSEKELLPQRMRGRKTIFDSPPDLAGRIKQVSW